MTILELIQKTTAFLQKKGVDEARLQTELMLAHVLGVKRMQLYLQFERDLKEEELAPLRELVRRRSEHEPLQYILGKTEFFGLEFKSDKRALIPRRETEHIIETVLGFWPDRSASPRCIDLGTGSGVLAVTLATQYPNSQWIAADQSADSLALASENAALHGLNGRVKTVKTSWWEGVADNEKFDLIVSNPPYIKSQDIQHLAPELREHEPLAALDGGADGIAAHRQIVSAARKHANPSARICMEIGFDQGPALQAILLEHGWKPQPTIKDLQGHDRVISGILE